MGVEWRDGDMIPHARGPLFCSFICLIKQPALQVERKLAERLKLKFPQVLPLRKHQIPVSKYLRSFFIRFGRGGRGDSDDKGNGDVRIDVLVPPIGCALPLILQVVISVFITPPLASRNPQNLLRRVPYRSLKRPCAQDLRNDPDPDRIPRRQGQFRPGAEVQFGYEVSAPPVRRGGGEVRGRFVRLRGGVGLVPLAGGLFESGAQSQARRAGARAGGGEVCRNVGCEVLEHLPGWIG
mmetsp:Transcript_33315/g.67985  ORF Transcript_33315/g.67985 Transcript_33315/m.67985 type:complete len:238 (+) Transcript_33315:275-988(+)